MMQSVVRYKFLHAKDSAFSEIAFAGPVISVIDAKRAIVAQKKLDKSNDDFDLKLKDAQSGEGCFFASCLA